jgi:hypothetical protein
VTATPAADGLRVSTEKRLSCAVRLFALVLCERPLALELFATRREAETALAEVLDDEPGFRELLEIRELAADTALDRSYPLSLN